MNHQISLTVNGIQHTLEPKPGETLSTLLRQRLRLTGTKIGCEEAECGACTVLVDGEPVVSCIYPAERAPGKTSVTIEGLARRVHEEMNASTTGFDAEHLNPPLTTVPMDSGSARLHPLQEAFVEHGAVRLALTQQELASFVNTTRESISHALHDLADRGLIRVERRSVVVLDRERLQSTY